MTCEDSPIQNPDDLLLDQLCHNLAEQSWGVLFDFFSPVLIEDLRNEVINHAGSTGLTAAGIGRGRDFMVDPSVRSDQTRWLSGETAAQSLYLKQMEHLRLGINRRLFLGLTVFEGHFALYEPGSFYAKHKDSFRGAANRVLSTVTYLNPDWNDKDGGQLILFDPESGAETARIKPEAGSLAVFLSEEIAHEVLISHAQRFSIAGWFRVGNKLSG
ncbi:2OG-Fe(II) oxygenase [Methylicorpusculum sp.]|uniref:2OG-Fe(II) oxygenase n=2 Tax=Methylicorpusculum sp. TaxID=2713644 RepID=UPI00272F357F|nr:2OG-Fe(II) oxygenase [Methylicorpusculum sp.]MDP2180134.1 2OG-Fe(II) oxygenase [Methylicorpusculum sp.]MDP3530687.1 2OG-Fe(II) oxygenase [Methylicorpusculum sp.]